MVQPSQKTDVLFNTSKSEKQDITSQPLDRDIEIFFLQGDERFGSGRFSPKLSQISRHEEQISKLLLEIKKLREEVLMATSRNQTLHNCWQSAIANHIESQALARAWISREASLRENPEASFARNPSPQKCRSSAKCRAAFKDSETVGIAEAG